MQAARSCQQPWLSLSTHSERPLFTARQGLQTPRPEVLRKIRCSLSPTQLQNRACLFLFKRAPVRSRLGPGPGSARHPRKRTCRAAPARMPGSRSHSPLSYQVALGGKQEGTAVFVHQSHGLSERSQALQEETVQKHLCQLSGQRAQPPKGANHECRKHTAPESSPFRGRGSGTETMKSLSLGPSPKQRCA